MNKLMKPVWSFGFLLAIVSISCSGITQERIPQPSNEAYVKQGANSSRLLGTFQTICAEDIEVYGDYVYIADGPGGISVIDVSDPTKPMLKCTTSTEFAFRVYVYEEHLYLCDGPSGIKVYSLADPVNPIETYSHKSMWALSMAFAESHLYLGDYFDGVKIFNLDDPAHPVLTTTHIPSRGRDLFVDGTTLALSDSAFGLATYHLTSPTEFFWTYIDASRLENFEDIVGYEGYSIIARNDEETTLSVFRTSDLSNIQLVDEYHPSRFICGLTRCGKVLLATCGNDGVLAYDLTNPESLQLLWSIDTTGYARRAKAAGDCLYVADMSGLGIYDITGLGGDWN
jgi:hypothetical protein